MLIKIRDIYGRTYLVDNVDLSNTTRYKTQVPLRHTNGLKFSDDGKTLKAGKAVTIHRDNIRNDVVK